jgi:integrase
MRREEILSLEWEKHIDLRHDYIMLDVTKNGERRQIPITPMLKETLQGIVRRVGVPYVFVDRDGKRIKDVKSAFNGALRRAGIKDFHFHDLRHALATIKDLLFSPPCFASWPWSRSRPRFPVGQVHSVDRSRFEQH